MCNKRRHMTWREARDVAKRLRKAGKHRYEYFCRACQRWHLTSRRPGDNREVKRKVYALAQCLRNGDWPGQARVSGQIFKLRDEFYRGTP